MDREECENMLLEKCRELNKIYHQYNPDGEYLYVAIISNYITVDNDYQNKDKNRPISKWIFD